ALLRLAMAALRVLRGTSSLLCRLAPERWQILPAADGLTQGISMPNYRSLVGGYYSSTPYDRAMKVSIRTNNPGAVNGSAWEKSMPGYVTTDETTPANHTTIFETPEQGVAVWWTLLRRYREAGVVKIGDIIRRYGGGQDFSNYIAAVVKWTGLPESTEIKLEDDDDTLLEFAKAMFRYEAGQRTPLSDTQILYGFDLPRGAQKPPS